MRKRAGGGRPRTLTGRLLLWQAIAVLGVLLVLALVLDRFLESSFVDQVTSSLISDARAVQQVLPADGSTGTLEPEVLRFGRALGVRVTVIRTDGVVLADSEHDPATMENHRTRPEVAEALQGRIGESSRRSATIGISFRYVALPPAGGRIVRVALPLTTVRSKVRTVRVILVVGFGLAALAGVLVLVVLAGGLSRPLRRITDAVGRVGSGDRDADVPEQGTEELVLLARTVNAMRREVAARAATAREERTARDAILSGLDEGIALFDPDGSTVYQNQQLARLLGGPVDAANRLGPPGLQELVAEVTGTGAARTTEVAAAARTLSATAARVPGDLRVLLVLRDVTRARILDAVRRDFVANASHELKTPAASIRALAETIASAASDDPEATRRFAGQLEREAVRLAGIVSDLLDLSRLEVGMEKPADLRFDQLVEDEAGRFEGRAEQSELTLTVQTEPVTVRGSPQDLALLVRNLVANAIQYTKPGGRIEVRVESNGTSAALMVRDTGIGIPAKDRGRIFERFYRVDRARSRETGGTGLGLSIVRHVVENHGGSVRVQSELGEGSTFTVRLPLAA
jgi:two-component system, OmpR family, phosphate regulon sensor histidine kinase PhoR